MCGETEEPQEGKNLKKGEVGRVGVSGSRVMSGDDIVCQLP